MSRPTKDQIDAWFDESRAAGRIPCRHLDALDLCRAGGVLEQFADAFCAEKETTTEPTSGALEKKVRGVLSRTFRELPVFGGPLGWEIEARLLDEATPEIVALLEDGKIPDS